MQTFMRRNGVKILLYSGLALLALALTLRSLGVDTLFWAPLFVLAIALKTGFLVLTFRARQFRWHLWLILILAGVAMILLSLVFKHIYPLPLLRNILFYGALALKLSGLLVLMAGKMRGHSTSEKE